MENTVYDVDLLTRAIEEVRQSESEPLRIVVPDNQHLASYAIMPKSAGRLVAEQVLILSGLDARAVRHRTISGHLISVEERAAELLGLEDHSIIFDDEVSLSAIARYRDQMANGDEPDGLDFDDMNFDNEEYYDLV